jgi:hypothetical protein
VLLSLWGSATAQPAAPGVYTDPTHRWSVLVPDGWTVEVKNLNWVMIKSDSLKGVVGIHTVARARLGNSLDDVARVMLAGWEQQTRAAGQTFLRVSQRRITLSGEVPAIEAVYLLGSGVVGKSRKVITVAQDRTVYIDAETFEHAWPTLEPTFSRIIDSFKVP